MDNFAAKNNDSSGRNSVDIATPAAASEGALKIVHEQRFQGEHFGIKSIGTGFPSEDLPPAFQSKNGDCYISTADHVVHNEPILRGTVGNKTIEIPMETKNPGKTTVTLPGGEIVKGTVVSEDPEHDQALIKIKKNSAKGQCVPAVQGDPDVLQPGDKVIASGFHSGQLLNSEKRFAGVTTVQEFSDSYGLDPLYKQKLDPKQKLLLFTSSGGGGGDSGGPIRNSKGEVIAQNIAGLDHTNPDGTKTHLSVAIPVIREKH